MSAAERHVRVLHVLLERVGEWRYLACDDMYIIRHECPQSDDSPPAEPVKQHSKLNYSIGSDLDKAERQVTEEEVEEWRYERESGGGG